MKSLFITGLLCVALVACGGSRNTDSNSNPNPNPNPPITTEVDYSKLRYTPLSTQPLVVADGEVLAQHLKNGLRLQVAGHDYSSPESEMAVDDSIDFSAAPPAAEGSGGSGQRFSETNVHVAGVDEADVAKYDGEHWFVLYHPQTSGELPGLQIVATNPAVPDAEIVGSYGFAGESWSPPGAIYLVANGGPTEQVVSLRSQWGNVYPRLPGGVEVAFATDLGWWPVNSDLEIAFIDVQNPAAPEIASTLTLEGSLIDSRRIGDTLYVITRFDPWLEGLVYDNGNAEVRSQNETLLGAIASSDLMPHFQKDGTRQPLTEDCLLQESSEKDVGFASLVHITAIDLNRQMVKSSQCINSSVGGMSMSPDALYLTGNIWQEDGSYTVIHKFDLAEEGPVYAATGNVPGTLGWRSDPAFRLHDYAGDLRIVTTEGQGWGNEIVHRLFVLEQVGNQLLPVAALPNETQPAAIGKPGEDIYAVRFTHNRAYIVTFRQVDPLYAIDLSEREAPRIIGELEVPGFATYIHPLNENYLFTLGQDADDIGFAEGIRAQLVKVSGDDPELVSVIGLGSRGSYSEALHDLRALSFLTMDDGTTRIALPVTIDHDYQWQYNGLQMIELGGLDTDTATMQDKGTLVAQANSNGFNYYSGGVHRGLLHEDAVFYAHDNKIWFSNWGEASAPGGPIGGEPVACTDDIRYGLDVRVESPDCNLTVTATEGSYTETLMRYDDNLCRFQGAAERAGLYQVTATRGEGSASAQVRVSADVCHVQTRYVNLVLE